MPHIQTAATSFPVHNPLSRNLLPANFDLQQKSYLSHQYFTRLRVRSQRLSQPPDSVRNALSNPFSRSAPQLRASRRNPRSKSAPIHSRAQDRRVRAETRARERPPTISPINSLAGAALAASAPLRAHSIGHERESARVAKAAVEGTPAHLCGRRHALASGGSGEGRQV